jgi:hypothetical protein
VLDTARQDIAEVRTHRWRAHGLDADRSTHLALPIEPCTVSRSSHRNPQKGQGTMTQTRSTRALCSAVANLCLAACGGGEIGGTLSGLGTGLNVTLRNNAADPLVLTRNGSFTFANSLNASSSYAVTVLTPPVGQSCEVASGTGTLNAEGDSIDSVRVTCADTASLIGTLSGLASGTAVTLANAGTQLPLTADGPFAFPGIVSDGTTYSVTVLSQPLNANCTLANGTGTFPANVATNIAVTCGPR